MIAAELAARLGAKKSGRQWLCKCVAHEDREPSMLIFDGREEGAVQVRCLAGCTPDEIITELERRGLWGDDTYNHGNTRPNTRVNARPPIKPAHLDERLINPQKSPPRSVAPDRIEIATAAQKREAARYERDRAQVARWLWSQRQPIENTAAERYLRDVRAISCELPSTLGYLPARGDNPHAMIAAFGEAVEGAHNRLQIDPANVVAVHLTKLDRDDHKIEKIMVGSPRGAPIVLSTINDLLGLVITEGIEDGLSVFQTTGVGVWAAGSASLMGALGNMVPAWIDCVTVVVDLDKAGQQHASRLLARLRERGVHAVAIPSRGGGFA